MAWSNKEWHELVEGSMEWQVAIGNSWNGGEWQGVVGGCKK